MAESNPTRTSLKITARDIRKGDRFTHHGVPYQATANAEVGKFGTYNVCARRLQPETINLDYKPEMSVLRAEESSSS